LKKIIIYSYPKCSTCRKAIKWLDQKGFEYQLIDIVKETPSVKYLNLALKEYSSEKRKIFNTRGKSFKSIDFNIQDASNEEIIRLLTSDGKLIKRPFLVYEEKNIILGFNETEYTNHLL
tara:strand:+ start:23 stop:379 length:357 start_codon:yes stop_codon:yes gene_type:complete